MDQITAHTDRRGCSGRDTAEPGYQPAPGVGVTEGREVGLHHRHHEDKAVHLHPQLTGCTGPALAPAQQELCGSRSVSRFLISQLQVMVVPAFLDCFEKQMSEQTLKNISCADC
jgi:hypothetical protein